MTTIHTLPFEVLQEVFSVSSLSTVCQCLFVCKFWNLVATQDYHKALLMDGAMITKFQSCLSVDKLPLMLSRFGHLVQSLEIHNDDHKEEKLTKNEIFTLLSYLPHLKTIKLSNCRKRESFMNHLDQILEDRSYQANGFLKKLERIQVSISKFDYREIAQYFRILYAFRASVKYLLFANSIPELFDGRNQVGGLLDFLCYFKCLTHLQMTSVGDESLSLSQISAACPNLIQLKLSSWKPITIRRPDDLSVTISQLSTPPCSGEPKKKFTRDLFPHLKSLCLSVKGIDINQLLLYMPKQLERLDLSIDTSMGRDLFSNWINGCNPSTLEQFIRRLKSLEYLRLVVPHFKPLNTKDNWETVCQQVAYRPSADWFNLVEAITEDNKLICHISARIGPIDMLDHIQDPSSITITEGRLLLNIGIPFLTELEEDGNPDTMRHEIDDQKILSFLPLFLGGDSRGRSALLKSYGCKQQLPSKIRHVRIISHADFRDKNLFNNFVFPLLENIFSNCTRLKSVEMEVVGSVNLPLSTQMKYKSLPGTLSYGKCVHLSTKERQHIFEASSTASNLLHCSIEEVKFTQRLCNIFNSFLPNLKVIDLKNCDLPERDEYNNLVLNLSHIAHLKVFMLDLSPFTIANIIRLKSDLYFQFEYIDCETNMHKVAYYHCAITNDSDFSLKYGRLSMEGLVVEPTTLEEMTTANGFESMNTVVITIKFAKINMVNLYDGKSKHWFFKSLELCPIPEDANDEEFPHLATFRRLQRHLKRPTR